MNIISNLKLLTNCGISCIYVVLFADIFYVADTENNDLRMTLKLILYAEKIDSTLTKCLAVISKDDL